MIKFNTENIKKNTENKIYFFRIFAIGKLFFHK